MACNRDIFTFLPLWGYWHCGHSWPIVPASGDSEDDCRTDGMLIGSGNQSSRRNLPQRHFCPSQNPTWPDPGLKRGRRGGKPTTNRLSYGAARRLKLIKSSRATSRVNWLKTAAVSGITSVPIIRVWHMSRAMAQEDFYLPWFSLSPQVGINKLEHLRV
jgi:hypothetical protein